DHAGVREGVRARAGHLGGAGIGGGEGGEGAVDTPVLQDHTPPSVPFRGRNNEVDVYGSQGSGILRIGDPKDRGSQGSGSQGSGIPRIGDPKDRGSQGSWDPKDRGS